jgi:hypothetical protein
MRAPPGCLQAVLVCKEKWALPCLARQNHGQKFSGELQPQLLRKDRQVWQADSAAPQTWPVWSWVTPASWVCSLGGLATPVATPDPASRHFPPASQEAYRPFPLLSAALDI